MNKWKKYLRKIRSCFVLFLLLIGLNQCQLIFLKDKSIKPEISPYFKIGDTLVYSSDSNVDSFYVEEAALYAPGETELHWNYEVFLSTILQFNCTDSCYKFSSSIDPTEYKIYVYGIDRSSFELVDYDERFAHLTLQIGKCQLEDLYKNYNTLDEYNSGKGIRTVYYSKKYGVVEYELTNGEVFYLDEACISMMEERHKKEK